MRKEKDPDLDPYPCQMDPDPQIREAQKHVDADPDPQHWMLKYPGVPPLIDSYYTLIKCLLLSGGPVAD